MVLGLSALMGIGPSGAASASPTIPTVPAGADEVWSVESIDGVTTVIEYDVADPASARAELARRGRHPLPAGRQPAPGVLGDLRAGAMSVEDGRCDIYGTASHWCGHYWEYNSYNDPQVYFLDYTPSGYPVRESVAQWYRSPGIDAYYRWYTSGCPNTRVHCVPVMRGSLDSGVFGETHWAAYAPQGPANVFISSTIGGTSQARKTVCHELGHALGLGHNTSTNSCMMQGQVSLGMSLYPSSQDFEVLNRLYPKPGT